MFVYPAAQSERISTRDIPLMDSIEVLPQRDVIRRRSDESLSKIVIDTTQTCTCIPFRSAATSRLFQSFVWH